MIHVEAIREFCLSLPGATEDFPFDEQTLAFRVMGKIFGLMALEKEKPTINLKCHPKIATQLRERYTGVKPGFHMNKTHWNTVVADGSFGQKELHHWIRHSYELVVAALPKRQREALLSDL